jgi:hypothetical protein
MLIELLQHHHELLAAAVWPLIWRRDCRSLRALGGTCRQLRGFLAAEVPFWAHFWRMRRCMNYISSINIINNEYLTLKENNGKLFIISYWNHERYAEGNPSSLIASHSRYLLWYIGHGRKIISMRYNKITITNDDNYIVKYVYIRIIGIPPEWLLKYVNNDYISLSDAPSPGWTFKIE